MHTLVGPRAYAHAHTVSVNNTHGREGKPKRGYAGFKRQILDGLFQVTRQDVGSLCLFHLIDGGLRCSICVIKGFCFSRNVGLVCCVSVITYMHRLLFFSPCTGANCKGNLSVGGCTYRQWIDSCKRSWFGHWCLLYIYMREGEGDIVHVACMHMCMLRVRDRMSYVM